jgi:hypothetical protein
VAETALPVSTRRGQAGSVTAFGVTEPRALHDRALLHPGCRRLVGADDRFYRGGPFSRG